MGSTSSPIVYTCRSMEKPWLRLVTCLDILYFLYGKVPCGDDLSFIRSHVTSPSQSLSTWKCGWTCTINWYTSPIPSPMINVSPRNGCPQPFYQVAYFMFHYMETTLRVGAGCVCQIHDVCFHTIKWKFLKLFRLNLSTIFCPQLFIMNVQMSGKKWSTRSNRVTGVDH